MKRWRKPVNNKWIRALALLLALSFTLTACKEAQEQPVIEKTTLTLWYYWDGAAVRQRLLKMVDEFNADHQDIQVTAQYVPDEDFKKKLALAIADGTAPDLAIVDSSDVQYYNDMKPLVDVSGQIKEDQYLDKALESCRDPDGRILGLPLGVNCLVFYYNETILAERHIPVPQTLDEFVDAAKRATSGNIYGCAFPSLQSEESLFCFLPVLWVKGGDLTNIDTKEGSQAFDVLRQLVKERGMSHRTVNMTLSDIAKEFAKGNIAMMFSTSGRDQQISKSNPGLDFKSAPLPIGDRELTVIGGEVLTIVCEENKDQSMEFVRFLAQPEQIKAYLEDLMYLAPRKDILDWQIKEYPEQKLYAEYLETGRAREFTPYWPAVSMAVADTINQVILEEEPEDFLEKLDQKIKSIREAYYEKN